MWRADGSGHTAHEVRDDHKAIWLRFEFVVSSVIFVAAAVGHTPAPGQFTLNESSALACSAPCEASIWNRYSPRATDAIGKSIS